MIIASEKESHFLERWSTVTYGGCNNTKLIMITTYRPCKPSSDQGPTTVNTQQWNILDEYLREKIIFDLGTHIIQLIDKQHEVILFVDDNEPHIYCSGINKLIKCTKMIDPILVRHGCATEPNTPKRVSDRIEFALYTRLINEFIKKSAVSPRSTRYLNPIITGYIWIYK